MGEGRKVKVDRSALTTDIFKMLYALMTSFSIRSSFIGFTAAVLSAYMDISLASKRIPPVVPVHLP